MNSPPAYIPEYRRLVDAIHEEISCPKWDANRSHELYTNLKVFSSPARMREELGRVSRECPELAGKSMRLVQHYLGQHGDADIALILFAGLYATPLLSDALDNHPILLYRPQKGRGRPLRDTLALGDPHPGHKLLLVDADMITGDTLRETASFYESQGYARESISAFLYLGAFRPRDVRIHKMIPPELGPIDRILDRSHDSSQ